MEREIVEIVERKGKELRTERKEKGWKCKRMIICKLKMVNAEEEWKKKD